MRFSRSCMRFFRPRLSISITPSVFGIGLPCAVSRDSLTIGSTQAVVEEPYACRANCRLRRSLVALTVHSRSGVSFIAEKPSSGLTRRRHVRASGMRGGYTAGRTWSAESGAERAQTVTQMAGATAAAVGRMGAGRGVVERAGQRAEAADIARCETTHGPH